jgi:hypothetical protein
MRYGTVMRVARPTERLDAVVRMYREGLGFEDHAGFDGVILGHQLAPYHLEFTWQRGRTTSSPPGLEHLLIFYIADRHEWDQQCARLVAAGFRSVPSSNPFWDHAGRTFEDVDGYRIVLQNAEWDA